MCSGKALRRGIRVWHLAVVHAAEVTTEVTLACNEAGGTLYRMLNDTCFTMTTSRAQAGKYVDKETAKTFCELNRALFPNVDCATVQCINPAFCGGDTGGSGPGACKTDCSNALFGAICCTLQPGFLVCLAPTQCVPFAHICTACSQLAPPGVHRHQPRYLSNGFYTEASVSPSAANHV